MSEKLSMWMRENYDDDEPSPEQVEHDSVVTCPECDTAIYPKWRQGVLRCPECRAAVRNYGIPPVRAPGNEIPNE